MDLQTRIFDEAINHGPLVLGMAWATWWLFPKMLRNGLSNGSGDIIRAIVRSENAEQTKHYSDKLDGRFEKREAAEDRRFVRLEDEVFRRRR
jgi:hypothetical protein